MISPHTTPSAIRRRLAAAFSLMELLTVVGIMAVLFVLATPVVSNLLDSNRLSEGGQDLSDQINLARQTSSARNRAVEVRLIQVPAHSEKGYSAVQLWMTDDSGNPRELGQSVSLPTGVTIAESDNLSKGINLLKDAKSSGDMPSNAAVGAGQPYVAFEVRPTGLVTPSLDMPDFFFTVVSLRSADATDLPDNFVMVQVNPLTASPLVYRP